jgi:hypothetical protein
MAGSDVGIVRLGRRRVDRRQIYRQQSNLAFWLASIAIVIAALCFMLTKIELTEAEMQKTAR